MIKFRRRSAMMCSILLLFVLSGCADRPFLTKDGVYSIVSVSAEETALRTPLQATWNSNIAVRQKLLLEAAFVLGDLRSLPAAESEAAMVQEESAATLPEHSEASAKETILLEATFSESKTFEFLIDNELKTLPIDSIQIEVIGNHPGRVLLNQSLILQGIPNPNLQSAFEEFLKMQRKT